MHMNKLACYKISSGDDLDLPISFSWCTIIANPRDIFIRYAFQTLLNQTSDTKHKDFILSFKLF